MLVLTRKHQESVVVINVDGVECLIKMTVLDLTGDRVKLGFEADKELLIHRSEVWDRIRVDRQSDQPTTKPLA